MTMNEPIERKPSGLWVSEPHFEVFEIYRDNAYHGRGAPISEATYLDHLQQSYNLRDVGKQSWWSATGLIVGSAMRAQREKARAENKEA